MQLAPQACALRLSLRLDTELGRLATSASVRHSVWKRRERSFSLADRVGVALERCPGLPSCWRLARTSSRESGLWLELRLRIMEPQPIGTVRVAHRRRLDRSPAGGVAACERNWFSRERSWRRRASEAGARAATSREAYPSTRVVGAGRTGPSTSASDAVGERPGLESGGSHLLPRS